MTAASATCAPSSKPCGKTPLVRPIIKAFFAMLFGLMFVLMPGLSWLERHRLGFDPLRAHEAAYSIASVVRHLQARLEGGAWSADSLSSRVMRPGAATAVQMRAMGLRPHPEEWPEGGVLNVQPGAHPGEVRLEFAGMPSQAACRAVVRHMGSTHLDAALPMAEPPICRADAPYGLVLSLHRPSMQAQPAAMPRTGC